MTYHVGQRVLASHYGHTNRLGVVVNKLWEPSIPGHFYDVRTLPNGVLPYLAEDLAPAGTEPQPGQWWTHPDTGSRLLVVDVGDGLVTNCRRPDGTPVQVMLGAGWRPEAVAR